MSAKYMPFPYKYPETGASGGAILKPYDKIPPKLETLDPCHRSLSFPRSLVYL